MLDLPKKSKKEKQSPNFVIFLVEGESDQIALETPLSELIFEKHPDYEVRFLLQQRVVNKVGDEVDDDGDDDNDECYLEEEEYSYGGDITSSSFVTPENIVIKIENRFFKPAIKTESLYPKRIAKIIHIVDLDGAYLPNENVIPLSADHSTREKPFYDGEHGIIEAPDVDGIRERNKRKMENVDFLLSLTGTGIKIKTSTIPYEIYFFSSNLDHFIHREANLESGKKAYADQFLRKCGLFTEQFCSFFYNDPSSIGKMGYNESWNKIKQQENSVRRFTNIDYLIYRLQKEE